MHALQHPVGLQMFDAPCNLALSMFWVIQATLTSYFGNDLLDLLEHTLKT